MPSAPHLRFSRDSARAEAVVLLLHGGREHGLGPVRPWDPGVLRLVPFGRKVVRASAGRIALVSLRYAVLGWNGEHESPLADARWALGRIAERFDGLPVGLVGHSMGGRVALRVGDHRVVRSVAALAPWLPRGEAIPSMEDRKVLLVHGTGDRTTDPRKTVELARNLREVGVEVELHELIGGRHSMLLPARPWHDLVTEFMTRTLLAPAVGTPHP